MEIVQTVLDKAVIQEGVSVPAGAELASAVEEVNLSTDSISRQVESATVRSMVRPVLDAYFQTSAVPSSRNVVADAMTTVQTTVSSARTDVVHDDARGAVLSGRISAGLPHTDLRYLQEEAPAARTNRAEKDDGVTPRSEKVVIEAVKGTMSTDSGESFDQEDGGSSFDRQAGVQNHAIQLKSGYTQPVSGQTEASREAMIHSDVLKQVVSQVREHLAGQEIKSGVEQVVIRLSPENLGELKLNLRMENQCLKVEIVAENSMVRDTLLKHSDTLKESLASQNITMETFDVSTGNSRNGAGSFGQNHADWQEQARQRQNAAWHSSGGYRLSNTAEIAKSPVHMASAEHSMLDVHF
jgi:flagellar hook-length control protein FliK